MKTVLLTHAMPEEAPRCELPSHVIPVLTGIGKALSVTRLALAVAQHTPAAILNVGFCGGLNGTPQGAIVLPTETLQWDLRLGDLRIPLGFGYHAPCRLPLSPPTLSCLAHPVRGLLVTGDRFIDGPLPDALDAVAVDMETAAIALFAREAGIPLTVIREVSDVADAPQKLSHAQFLDYIRHQGPAYSGAVMEWVSRQV